VRAEHERDPRKSGGPWYAAGLRFTCVAGCGRCCTRRGPYAYVYLRPDDSARLAERLGLSLGEFRKRYVRRQGPHSVLRMNGRSCPFLEGTLCSVYEARPLQCRTFPFWPELLETEARWRRLARFCPGIGRGELVSLRAIRERLGALEEEA
jgi:hypothetical protein